MDWIGDLGMAAAAVKIVDMVLGFITANKVLWFAVALPLALWALHVAPGKFRFSGRIRLGIMGAVTLYMLWAMVLFTVEQWRTPVPRTRSPGMAVERPAVVGGADVSEEPSGP